MSAEPNLDPVAAFVALLNVVDGFLAFFANIDSRAFAFVFSPSLNHSAS